jgi:hypothetical protein
MDCPVNTVKTRLFHARAKLQRLLPQLATPAGESADGSAPGSSAAKPERNPS